MNDKLAAKETSKVCAELIQLHEALQSMDIFESTFAIFPLLNLPELKVHTRIASDLLFAIGIEDESDGEFTRLLRESYAVTFEHSHLAIMSKFEGQELVDPSDISNDTLEKNG